MWEDLCNGCGECCALGRFEGKTRFACRSFDCETNRCKVYEDRLETELCCEETTPERVIPMYLEGHLPASCSLVRYMQGKEQIPMVPADLIPFALLDESEQERYIVACNKWKLGYESKG